ncbi:carboxylesterase/lipase family protein [Halochromatium sp.]
MSLECNMPRFAATLCLLSVVGVASGEAPATDLDSAKTDAALENSCTTASVRTSSGLFCGLEQQVESQANGGAGRSVIAFLGIPYGESTAGSNRWAPPVPFTPKSIAPTDVPQSATRFGPSCPQALKPGVQLDLSEDCLSLNIWTPVPPDEVASADPLPVMIFIYGGSFVDGNSSNPLFDGRHLAAIGDVVVVTLNYRLGALGFLAGIDGLKGNYGLMDQRLAMEWVRDNIAKFGGDPEKVTIFGQSAGAMSVGLHLISPASQPLFAAAIMESNPYGIPYKSLDLAAHFASILQANLGCEREGLTCLRGKPFEHLVAHQAAGIIPMISILSGFATELVWAPVLDGEQVPAQPSASAITKPAILGTTLNEGLIFAVSQQTRFGGTKPQVLKIEYELMLDLMFSVDIARRIEAHPRYAPRSGDNTNIMSQLITDYLFTCANRHVLSQAEAPVWAYQFRHPPSFNIWPDIAPCAPATNTVCHAAELPFVFANADTAEIQADPKPHQLQPSEQQLSQTLIDYWTRFAKQQNPNPAGDSDWAPFSTTSPTRFILDLKTESKTDLDANCDFWDEIGYDRAGFLERVRKL